MLSQEKGTISGSEYFHLEPAEDAKNLLYYVTACGVYFCEYGYRIDREDYGNYMLLYVDKGNLVIMSEGRTYLVQQGQVAFFNCHIPHSYYAKGYVQFSWIHFDGANTKDFFDAYIKNEKGIIFSSSQTEHIQKSLNKIISKYKNNLDVREVDNSKIIYDCICGMLFDEEDSNVSDNTGLRVTGLAKEYIRKNFEHELSLNNLAEHVGLSQCHFSRVFKQETGYSPYEYTILVRMNKAKHLLGTTNKTVKEIAFEVGYQSESNFCNAFTSKIGISPKKFRKYQL